MEKPKKHIFVFLCHIVNEGGFIYIDHTFLYNVAEGLHSYRIDSFLCHNLRSLYFHRKFTIII